MGGNGKKFETILCQLTSNFLLFKANMNIKNRTPLPERYFFNDTFIYVRVMKSLNGLKRFLEYKGASEGPSSN